jgi:hypothetical protein
VLPSPGVLSRDPAAHGLNQLGADGEPKAGAAVAAGGGGVRLGEGFEDQVLLFGGMPTPVSCTLNWMDIRSSIGAPGWTITLTPLRW